MAELSVSGPEVLYNDDSEIRFKKAKREQSGLIGKKNVVVLKSGDVVRRNGFVYMPNTIEMACIKKPATGQFKTNVEFSSVMSEDDVMARLEKTFPILTGQRVFCAAASNFRTRLEFHGKPRLWDGRCIKKWIKGNSALYVLTELKGGQDVMFEQSLGESHPDPDSTLLHNFPNGFKLPIPRLVTSCGKRCAQKAVPATMGDQIDIVTTPEGQHFMVTAAGYSTLSATGISAQNASRNQKASGVHQASLYASVVSSQMRHMHISSTASSNQQPTKTSYVIAATAQDNSSIQSIQVPLSSSLPQGSKSVMKETDRSMTLEVSMETTQTLASRVGDVPGSCSLKQSSGQHGDLSHDPPRTSSCATGHSHDSLVSSVAETPELDSGFNTGDSFLISASGQTSASIGSTLNCESTRPPSTTEEEEEDSGQEDTSMEIEFGDGSPLCMLSRVASVAAKIRSATTKYNSIVRDISPKSSTLEGGGTFYIILEKPLRREVTEGKAFFGQHGPPVSLNVVNRHNFKGVVPPAQNPGLVFVKVETSEGRYLGKSLFQYEDQIRDLVQKMARDVKAQAHFFHLWSNELGKKSKTEGAENDCNKERHTTVQNTEGETTSECGYLADVESLCSDNSDSSEEANAGRIKQLLTSIDPVNKECAEESFECREPLLTVVSHDALREKNEPNQTSSSYNSVPLRRFDRSGDEIISEEAEEFLCSDTSSDEEDGEVHPSNSSWTRFQGIVCKLNDPSNWRSSREILMWDNQYRDNRVVVVLGQSRYSYREEGPNHDASSAEQFQYKEYEKCLDSQDLGNKQEISHDQSSRNEETPLLNTDIYYGERAQQSRNFGECDELHEDSENTRGTQDCDDVRHQSYSENVEHTVERSAEKKENEVSQECDELNRNCENTKETQECVEVRHQCYSENVEHTVKRSAERKENEVSQECEELNKYCENTKETQGCVEVRHQSYSENVEHTVERSAEKKENEKSQECDELNKDGENTTGTQDCDEVRPQSYSRAFELEVNQATIEKKTEASTDKPDGGQSSQELQLLEGERAVDGSVSNVAGDFQPLSLEVSVDSHVRDIPQMVDHSTPNTENENTSVKTEDDERRTQEENKAQVQNQPGTSHTENIMVSEVSFRAQGESSLEV